ncbi:MAG: sigma-70 family RNA polymerase sigma factor [Bacteroidaceae bacterium]|nr:sigma-70 family RNA polymerase sigma factor [Bacteroidaceae bacterium]
MGHELYNLCKRYYDKNFHKPNIGSEGGKDILQSSLLALWDNIRSKKLYVEDGLLKGKDGNPFTCSITTYFISIAHNQYLEWIRKNPIVPPIKLEKIPEGFSEGDDIEFFVDDDETLRKRKILSYRINHMTKQCSKILTLFYYEEKDYDEIMVLLPTFQSKDAIKTAKYKCLKRLRESVIGTCY